jgi:hydrogenase maturation protease
MDCSEESCATRVLVLCYGNPGRGDDGLGPAVADAIEHLQIPGVSVDCDYQLTVEDSVAASEHDVVIFADADASGTEPFSFYPIAPRPLHNFTSHSVEPEEVLGLVEQIFNRRPEGYVLGIRGYQFAPFTETLTDHAAENLRLGLRFLEQTLRTRDFRATETRVAGERLQDQRQSFS